MLVFLSLQVCEHKKHRPDTIFVSWYSHAAKTIHSGSVYGQKAITTENWCSYRCFHSIYTPLAVSICFFAESSIITHTHRMNGINTLCPCIFCLLLPPHHKNVRFMHFWSTFYCTYLVAAAIYSVCVDSLQNILKVYNINRIALPCKIWCTRNVHTYTYKMLINTEVHGRCLCVVWARQSERESTRQNVSSSRVTRNKTWVIATTKHTKILRRVWFMDAWIKRRSYPMPFDGGL